MHPFLFKQKSTLLTILTALALGACGGDESAAQGEDNSATPQTSQSSASANNVAMPAAHIGVIFNNVEGKNDFLRASYKGVRDAVTQNPQLKVAVDTTAGDQNAQEAMARSMLAQGAKALFINPIDPNNPALPAMVEKFCNENIPVVYYNRNPGERQMAACGEKAYLITGDDTQAGLQQGLAVLEGWQKNPAWDKNGDGVIQYAIVKAADGVLLTQERSEWVAKTLQSYPQLGKPTELLFSGHANFSAAFAEEEVSKWLDDPRFAQVEVIVANTDDLALGAFHALQKRNIKLPVFGADGVMPALEAVRRGELAGTTACLYDQQAADTVRVAANLAAGKPALEGLPESYNVVRTTIRTPCYAVTPENVGQYIK